MYTFAVCLADWEGTLALLATWLGACAWSVSLFGGGAFVVLDGIDQSLEVGYPQDTNEVAMVLILVQSAVHFAAARAGMAIAAGRGRLALRRRKYSEPLAYSPRLVPSPIYYLGARTAAAVMDGALLLSSVFQPEDGSVLSFKGTSANDSSLSSACRTLAKHLDILLMDLSVYDREERTDPVTSWRGLVATNGYEPCNVTYNGCVFGGPVNCRANSTVTGHIAVGNVNVTDGTLWINSTIWKPDWDNFTLPEQKTVVWNAAGPDASFRVCHDFSGSEGAAGGSGSGSPPTMGEQRDVRLEQSRLGIKSCRVNGVPNQVWGAACLAACFGLAALPLALLVALLGNI
jgi:hypothetical protein